MSTALHSADPSLAHDCVRYFHDEQSNIDRVLACVKAVRESLLKSDMTELEQALKQLAEVPSAELAGLRKRVRNELGRLQQVAGKEVQLEDVARYVQSTLHVDLSSQVTAMRETRREIATVNRANIAVSQALSRVVDRFIQLAAGVQSVSTYGPKGEIHRSHQSKVVRNSA